MKKYEEVQRSTKKYEEVQRSTKKYERVYATNHNQTNFHPNF